jgi:hypothetical protein
MSIAHLSPSQVAKDINAHVAKGNGIYMHSPTGAAGRFFAATVIDGSHYGRPPAAYVTPDFGETWVLVPMDATFNDGNWGVPIGKLPGTK